MWDKDWYKRRADEGPPISKEFKIPNEIVDLFFKELGKALKRKLRRKENE